MGIFHRHPVLLLLSLLTLPMAGCHSSEPPEPQAAERARTGEEWVIEAPAAGGGTTAPANGARSFKAGVVWKTDGSQRLSCRYWIDFEWNAQAGAYVSKGRLALSPERPSKMELLLDVRPWLVGNEVRVLVEPVSAEGGSLGPGRLFERASRDYVKGPQLAVVLKQGETDLLGPKRALQDVRLTVRDPERDGKLFAAVLKLSLVEGAPTCE